MCVYIHHLHIHAPPYTTKIYIYLVGLPSIPYETPGHNERSVLNQLFLLLFSEKHMKSVKSAYERPFARNCTPIFNMSMDSSELKACFVLAIST